MTDSQHDRTSHNVRCVPHSRFRKTSAGVRFPYQIRRAREAEIAKESAARERLDFNASVQKELTDEARGGNTEAAVDILREFAEAVDLSSEHGSQVRVPSAHSRYIAEAFRKIIDQDMDAGLALGIKTSKAGRPKGTKTHNDVELAAAYWFLIRQGHRPEEANSLLEKTGVDRRTIQRAAKACSGFGDKSQFDDEVLKSVLLQSSQLSKFLIAE